MQKCSKYENILILARKEKLVKVNNRQVLFSTNYNIEIGSGHKKMKLKKRPKCEQDLNKTCRYRQSSNSTLLAKNQ